MMERKLFNDLTKFDSLSFLVKNAAYLFLLLLFGCTGGPHPDTAKKIADMFGASSYEMKTEVTNKGTQLTFILNRKTKKEEEEGMLSAIALGLYESSPPEERTNWDFYVTGVRDGKVLVTKSFTVQELENAHYLLTTVVDPFLSELKKGNDVSYRYDTTYIPDSVQQRIQEHVVQHIRPGEAVVTSYGGFLFERTNKNELLAIYSIDHIQGKHGLRYFIEVSPATKLITGIRTFILDDVKLTSPVVN